ncbi:MAG: hypothetical protein GY737_19355 [Desulfobacteraceae bacterium]|nr:hypothetical protein [Desulfobacteraceae bacterium]
MDRSGMEDTLERALAELFQEQGPNAEHALETFLRDKLSALEHQERTDLLLQLIQRFDPECAPANGAMGVDDILLARICSLLLGRDLTQEGLTPDQLLEKLAESLNTVFDALNRLISTINTTLVGEQDSDQTIRQVIGYHLGGEKDATSLEKHIGQISSAFLATQNAFKQAAQAKVEQILREFAPERIEQDAGVTRLSPMRKAKCYDAYEAKFAKFRRWVESDGFMESYLREVERNCHKISL